jgi:HEAT repeat protein
MRRAMSCVCVGLLMAASAGAQEPERRSRVDPVEPLWQALHAPVRGSEARDAQIRAALDHLRSADDLRRALLLNGWRDGDQDQEIAAVDARHRSAVVDRFARAVRNGLRQKDLDGRLAALALIGSLDPGVRGNGNESLARDFTGDLAELIRFGPAVVCEPAARTLGLIIPEPRAAVAALEALLHDPDPHLRAVAGETLGALVVTALPRDPAQTEHEDVIRAACAVAPVAAGGVTDAVTEVRYRCVEALGHAAEALGALVADVADADEIEDWQAYQHEVETERSALRPLAVALRDQCGALARASGDSDVGVRILARHALEDIAAARVRWLRRASSAVEVPAGQGDPGSASRSATFLLDEPLLAGLRTALPALTKGVTDPDAAARRAAIDALEALGQQASSAAPALVGALSDPDRFVRWSAARALGKAHPTDMAAAVAALAHLLGSSDTDLRLAAASALSAFGPAARPALPALAEAAQAREPQVRLAVLRVLESIGSDDAAALAVLSAARDDSDARVRQLAAVVLDKVGQSRTDAVKALMRPSARVEETPLKTVESVRPR